MMTVGQLCGARPRLHSQTTAALGFHPEAARQKEVKEVMEPLQPASALDFPIPTKLDPRMTRGLERAQELTPRRQKKKTWLQQQQKQETKLRSELATAHNALRKQSERMHVMRAALLAAGIKPASGENW